MKGWHKESYRHYLAAKGIRTSSRGFYAKKYKRLTPDEFKKELEGKGAYSRAEIKLSKRPKGKKYKLEREREFREDALKELGYDPEMPLYEMNINELPDYVVEHYQKLDGINERLKRLTGSPAYKDVRGKTASKLKEELYKAQKGTSQKKSDPVLTILEGLDLSKDEGVLDKELRRQKVARKNFERANYERVLPIIEEKYFDDVVGNRKYKLGEIKLKDVERSKRGRNRSVAPKEKIKGGLADNMPDSEFKPNNLKKGIKVEMEHTSDPDVAKEIAKDHLAESSKYYDELEKMEKNL